MGMYFNQGNDLFLENKNSEIYIDKSMLIKQTNSIIRTNRKYISISRPRRFGKSMAANMLVAYYGRDCDSKELFAGLEIAKDESFGQHLNKYNVVHLVMTDFSDSSVFDMISEIEETLMYDIQCEYTDLKLPPNLTLYKLLNIAYQQTKIPYVFIIDEWDMVMRVKKYSKEDQESYLVFLRKLLKDKSYVALAYMTGILPIKKYGEQSALNDFFEYSMENAQPFSELTGFTEKETEGLCKKYGINMEEAKKWYNGYNVDGISIYNPRSIVELCNRKKFASYWTKTETYESLKVYIKLNFDGLREKVEQMLSGEKVAIDTGTFQNDMISMQSADDVLTLLIHLGYLTYDFDTKSCWIPNQEVADEFVRSIKANNWTEVINAIQQSEECLRATLNGDEETVARIVEQTHQENTSIIKYNDENALSCIITLSYYTARNKYEIIRELPSGKGYADIAFIPRANENLPAIVVELKKEQDESIAIEQIKSKRYFDSLKAFAGEIILVGINYKTDSNHIDYKKHTCKIERIMKH